jgi:hypothetical protein
MRHAALDRSENHPVASERSSQRTRVLVRQNNEKGPRLRAFSIWGAGSSREVPASVRGGPSLRLTPLRDFDVVARGAEHLCDLVHVVVMAGRDFDAQTGALRRGREEYAFVDDVHDVGPRVRDDPCEFSE